MYNMALARSFFLFLIVFLSFRSCVATQSRFFDIAKNTLSGDYSGKWDDGSYCNYTGISCDDQENVVQIDISGWSLSGKFPIDQVCSFLPKLRVLRAGNNNFNESFPPGIVACTLLEELNMSSTRSTGLLPDFSPLKALKILDLSYNRFSGDFPLSIVNLTNLEVLNFNENEGFSWWKLPHNISSLIKLQSMVLTSCMLFGEIPGTIGDMSSLIDLELSGNYLTGRIPKELGKLKNLKQLELYYNQLDGEIPEELGNLTELEDLDMSVNKFSGSIPESICRLPNLKVFQLYNNSLTGAIPAVIANSTTLNTLSLYDNFLTGEVPKNLGKSSAVVALDLSENRLSGKLPEGLCSRGKLNYLLMLQNSISGELPESYAKFYNRKKINHAWLIGVSVGIIVLGTILFLKRCLSKDKKMLENEDTVSSSVFSYDFKCFHRLTFDQREIMEAMIEKNIVGYGGSGTVYKIHLKHGDLVAVKKLWTSRKAKDSPPEDRLILDKGLKTEVETLGSIRHKNIVKLYCYLSSPECSLLVYEYMTNGNLWNALHNEKFFNLDWPKRHQIALGIAQGLVYLHHDLLFPIIHRDIKSTNILLDADYQPKVADFGIAKVLQARGSKDSTTTVIAGTYGYLAPEYAFSSKATTKCDVYSFGVVLMELLTGRKPVEAEFGENKNIIYWVASKVETKEGALEILDRRVSGLFKEEMIKVLLIAIRCTCRTPALRPTMNEVVQLLVEADPCRFECCMASNKLKETADTTTKPKNSFDL